MKLIEIANAWDDNAHVRAPHGLGSDPSVEMGLMTAGQVALDFA